MPLPSKLRIAVIGLGWAALNRHIPALRRQSAFQLVGVIDPKEEITKACARQFALPHIAQGKTLQDIPWIDQIDALVIATPPTSHAALAIEALSLGKHILIEKPFTPTLEEAESIVNARAVNSIIALNHNFLFCSAYQRLKQDLGDERLGRVVRVRASHFSNPLCSRPAWYNDLALGAMTNEIPHLIYLLYDLAGGALHLRRAHGIGTQGQATPSHAQIAFCNDQRIPYTIDVQYNSSLSEWHLMVMGEKETGLVDLYRDIYIRLPNDGRHGPKDVLRTSFSSIYQHSVQTLTNGLAYIAGKLDYGTSAVYDRFAQSIETGVQDEKIGFDASLSTIKLQSDATNTILGNLYS